MALKRRQKPDARVSVGYRSKTMDVVFRFRRSEFRDNEHQVKRESFLQMTHEFDHQLESSGDRCPSVMDHANGVGFHGGRVDLMIPRGVGKDHRLHRKVLLIFLGQSCAHRGHHTDQRNVFFAQIDVKRLKENTFLWSV